ncbi:hypothetical protein Taro_039211 [Colocasia esculenta]|uniref:CRAL-TRIO domain-containing protein n=1 Tax=Colocasia esculenta TaxID=4460 RepID=A0A843WF28_COLES|nr:hypothetical protein [Colocasia esculenta]
MDGLDGKMKVRRQEMREIASRYASPVRAVGRLTTKTVCLITASSGRSEQPVRFELRLSAFFISTLSWWSERFRCVAPAKAGDWRRWASFNYGPAEKARMGKEDDGGRERIEAVLHILRKQTPLTVKQEKFCTDACVGRFLKTKGESVKKAAKHLRACFSWRDAIGIEHLMADEFSAELAEGVAYLAGHDDEARPVLVFRIKQDYLKTHSQKSYLRLLVFTLEVAISTMSRFVEQFVLLFDASLFRSASAFLSLFMGTFKIISENYPGRLHKAFVIDPPSLFSYLWKGARPFVDLWTSTAVVSSLDIDDAFDEEPPFSFASAYGHPRTSSLRFDSSTVSAKVGRAGGGGSTSSRFSFTVSHIDALKPWYLTRTEPSPPLPAAATSPSLVGLSPLNARSFSFASPGARYAATPQHRRVSPAGNLGTRSIPSTPSSKRAPPSSRQLQPRTPRPSFLQSPAMRLFGGGKDGGQRQEEVGRGDKGREAFLPFVKFYRRPYDEIMYRSKMRPPLGGLISVVSPQMIRQRRHLSHQRF